MEEKQELSMEKIRRRIDLIDRELIGLIAQRNECVKQAATFKKDKNSIEDSKRVDQVINNIKIIARETGLDESLAEKIYHTMIDAFIRQEFQKVFPWYEELKKFYY